MNKIIILSQVATVLTLCGIMVQTGQNLLVLPILFTFVSIILNVIVWKMERSDYNSKRKNKSN